MGVFTAAMLEGRNNETVLHENRTYFPGERKCIVLPSNMAAMTLYENALYKLRL